MPSRTMTLRYATKANTAATMIAKGMATGAPINIPQATPSPQEIVEGRHPIRRLMPKGYTATAAPMTRQKARNAAKAASNRRRTKRSPLFPSADADDRSPQRMRSSRILERGLIRRSIIQNALAGTGMSEWYVGQRVVCVDTGFLDFSDAPELTEGGIYTVTEVLPRRRGYFGLRVREVEAKEKYHAFDERRFRPLTEAARDRRQASDLRDGSASPSSDREAER